MLTKLCCGCPYFTSDSSIKRSLPRSLTASEADEFSYWELLFLTTTTAL